MQGVVDDWHHVVREEKIAVENQGFVDYVLMESLYTVYIYTYVYDPKPQTRRYLATFHSKIKWGRPELLIIVANNLINYGC